MSSTDFLTFVYQQRRIFSVSDLSVQFLPDDMRVPFRQLVETSVWLPVRVYVCADVRTNASHRAPVGTPGTDTFHPGAPPAARRPGARHRDDSEPL